MSAAPAWDDETTRVAWYRARRIGRVWLVLALLAFVGATAYANRVHDESDELGANGVSAQGVVLADPPIALRCGLVPVPIRFPVDGRPRIFDFHVRGCGGSGLSKGDRVSVRYDRSDPSRFTVEGTVDENPWWNLVALVALVLAVFFAGGWAIRARRLHVLRGILESHPYRTTTVDVSPYESPWTRGLVAVDLTEDGRTDRLSARPGVRARELEHPGAVDCLVTGVRGGSRAMRALSGTQPVLARRPRTASARRRLAAVPPTTRATST
jgi:hypothetical protein